MEWNKMEDKNKYIQIFALKMEYKNKLVVCIISSDKNKYEIKHIENTYNILK